MTRITPSLLATAALALSLQAAPAQAFSHTYVSAASGSDGNSCGLGAPCRTFQRAHNQTNDQGEITVLDPGDYGIVTISKSISIVNDGNGEASILVSGNNTGITIDAANAYVNLRGLTVQGVGTGTGILFGRGFSPTMENCVVRNHTRDGIQSSAVPSSLAVSNTLVADNGGRGIVIEPVGSGVVKAVLDRVEVYNNSGTGIEVFGNATTGTMGTINVTVVDSVAAGNFAGFRAATSPGQATTNLMLVRSVAADNGTGLVADGAAIATLRVGQSTVTGNTQSWHTDSGAVLRSYGDNDIDGNGDGDPPLPVIGKK